MNEQCVECVDFANARELIDYLRPINPVWGNEITCSWVYRGHWEAAWPLQPRAWREDGQAILKPLISRFTDQESHKHADKRELRATVQQAASCEAVRQFAQLADELGQYVPDYLDWAQSGEQFLNVPFEPVEPDEFFAYAQHHGIPTQLLDWTRNPLVGAFFATQPTESVQPVQIAVWAVNLRLLEEHWSEFKTVTCRRSRHTFLHAQDGLFLWCSDARSFFLKQGRWPTFPEIIEAKYDGSGPKPLRKLALSVDCVDDLSRLLLRERVFRAHLMPSYDNVTTALLDRWRLESKSGGQG